MDTFKDFFKKHLAFNLLAIILPCFLFILGFFLVPQGYGKWDIDPAKLGYFLNIIAIIGIVVFVNLFLTSNTIAKKITFTIVIYIAFALYFLAYFFVAYSIFAPQVGFIADIMQENSSKTHLITDCLYTVLAPSFVTVFIAVGVIIFTVYLIKSTLKSKKQPLDIEQKTQE